MNITKITNEKKIIAACLKAQTSDKWSVEKSVKQEILKFHSNLIQRFRVNMKIFWPYVFLTNAFMPSNSNYLVGL